jgi:large subunit ribosomal protein L25
MKKISLQVQERLLLGRKVKQLRTARILPATIYGKKVPSMSVQVSQDDFAGAFKAAGETGLIELQVGGSVRPVLVKGIQVHPVSGFPLHVDFYQVDLKEKVSANVPLEVVGEAPAVAEKIGALLTLIDEIEVEALPTDLPENIEVDVSGLAKIGDVLQVKDLKLPSGVVALTDGTQEVVRIDELISKEAEEQAKEEQAAAAEAATPEGGEAKAPEATASATTNTPTEQK